MSAPTTAATTTAMPVRLRQHLTGWAGALPAAAELLLTHPERPHDARSLTALPRLLGKPGHIVERVAFGWTVAPADLPSAGCWVDSTSPRLPGGLRPFGGQALVAFDEHGDYLAGVDIKRHDELGHEISVGTEPQARGRGLAAPGRPDRPTHTGPGQSSDLPAHVRQPRVVPRRHRRSPVRR